MKILLSLYPRLGSPNKKAAFAENVNFNFEKNQARLNYYQQAGYRLSPQQTNKLIDCIDSGARLNSKDDAQEN